MAEWDDTCSARLNVPTVRPDVEPFVFVPLSPQWRDLFIDLCAILEEGRIWAEGEDLDEGYTSALIATVQFLKAKEIQMTPVGATMVWFGTVFPPGWLLCDGDTISKTQYPELFDVIGYLFGGSGDDFTLPSMVDLSPMGAGSVVGIGAESGSLETILAVNHLPTHTHAINDPGHTHTPLSPATSFRGFHAGGTGGIGAANNGVTNDSFATTGNTTTGITIGNTGENAPVSILHPVRGVHWLIWSGVV